MSREEPIRTAARPLRAPEPFVSEEPAPSHVRRFFFPSFDLYRGNTLWAQTYSEPTPTGTAYQVGTFRAMMGSAASWYQLHLQPRTRTVTDGDEPDYPYPGYLLYDALLTVNAMTVGGYKPLHIYAAEPCDVAGMVRYSGNTRNMRAASTMGPHSDTAMLDMADVWTVIVRTTMAWKD